MNPANLNGPSSPKSPGRVWLGRIGRVAVALTAVALFATAAWAVAPEFPKAPSKTHWASVIYATSTPPVVTPAGFEDVDAGSVHAESIKTVATLQIAPGITTTAFLPSQMVTRAQMATFMARTWEAAGRECPSSGIAYFDDVVPGSPYTTGMDCMSALRVVMGTGPRAFSPSQTVTRAQMASFLARMWTKAGQECPAAGALSFTDVPAGSLHAASIDCISALGITRGATATTFSPSQAVTRGQMASFLARFHKALPPAAD